MKGHKHGCVITTRETNIHSPMIFVAAHPPYQWYQEDTYIILIKKESWVRKQLVKDQSEIARAKIGYST